MTITGRQARTVRRMWVVWWSLCGIAASAAAQPPANESCLDIFRLNVSARLDAARHRNFRRLVTESYCRSFGRLKGYRIDGDPAIDFTPLIRERGVTDQYLSEMWFRSCSYAGAFTIAARDLLPILGVAVDPGVLEAYSRCMTRKETAPGIQIELIDPAEQRFEVLVRWNGADASDTAVVQQVDTGSARCAPVVLKPELTLKGEWVSQPCTRSDTNPVRVQVEIRAATSAWADARVPRVFAGAHGARGPACADTVDIVGAAYRQMLGRDADPGGLAWHVERLEAGVETVQDVIRSLAMSSAFHRTIIDPAVQAGGVGEALKVAYRRILGREVDSNGAKEQPPVVRDYGWARLLASLVASPEYRSAFQTDTVPYARGTDAKPLTFCR